MGNRRMGTYHVAQLSRATGPDENHITAAATDDLRELVLGQRGAVEELAGADGVGRDGGSKCEDSTECLHNCWLGTLRRITLGE
jgi:hypothetical protein